MHDLIMLHLIIYLFIYCSSSCENVSAECLKIFKSRSGFKLDVGVVSTGKDSYSSSRSSLPDAMSNFLESFLSNVTE